MSIIDNLLEPSFSTGNPVADVIFRVIIDKVDPIGITKDLFRDLLGGGLSSAQLETLSKVATARSLRTPEGRELLRELTRTGGGNLFADIINAAGEVDLGNIANRGLERVNALFELATFDLRPENLAAVAELASHPDAARSINEAGGGVEENPADVIKELEELRKDAEGDLLENPITSTVRDHLLNAGFEDLSTGNDLPTSDTPDDPTPAPGTQTGLEPPITTDAPPGEGEGEGDQDTQADQDLPLVLPPDNTSQPDPDAGEELEPEDDPPLVIIPDNTIQFDPGDSELINVATELLQAQNQQSITAQRGGVERFEAPEELKFDPVRSVGITDEGIASKFEPSLADERQRFGRNAPLNFNPIKDDLIKNRFTPKLNF